MAAMTMAIERVVASNGLDVLVARDEGLFAAEGLDLRIAALPPGEIRSAAEGTFEKPVTNQGVLHGPFDVTAQINRTVEREAHELATAGLG